jgi:hypothetical protein
MARYHIEGHKTKSFWTAKNQFRFVMLDGDVTIVDDDLPQGNKIRVCLA